MATTTVMRKLSDMSRGLSPQSLSSLTVGCSSMHARIRRCGLRTTPTAMGMNLIEKIVQRHAVDHEGEVQSGQFCSVQPAYCMTHDNSAAVIPKFVSLGAKKVANPTQVVFTLDHNVQDTSDKNLKKYQDIANFAKENGIDFYPAGRGIGHQVMCEEGYAYPFRMVVASDSHSNMYGGVGALGTPVVRTDAACIWATGKTWWQVPKVARVKFEGKLQPGVSGKDVIVTLCGVFNNDEVLNHAVEFSGDGVQHLSVDDRLTIANMTTEWGALAGVFVVDEVTLTWLQKRMRILGRRGLSGNPSDVNSKVHPRCDEEQYEAVKGMLTEMQPDADAKYAQTITVNLDSVRPHVSGPNTVKDITSVDEISKQQIKINKAYLVSCVNSRAEDLAAAADIVRGKKIASHVEMYVAAASSEVQAETEENGDWETLLAAGCLPLPPGCGPCIGLGKGLLEDNEVGISATNRNFRGRMGSRNAQAYLGSPIVVAASALAGYITGPECKPTELLFSVEHPDTAVVPLAPSKLIEGFPTRVQGRVLLCAQSDINTDGIYPGKYTYEELTTEKMREVVMENYDSSFASIVREGDILVAGANFGTGSSREQAATALKAAGIAAVFCESVNQTYQRNAINNGLVVLEVPGLAALVSGSIEGTPGRTEVPGLTLDVDYAKGTVTVGGATTNDTEQVVAFNGLGPVCQHIVVAGGLEKWIQQQL